MRRISRRAVIRGAGTALAAPLLESIAPFAGPSALQNRPSAGSLHRKPKYRRIGTGSLFEDERGWFRYSIRGEEVFQYAHFYFGWGSRPDKAHLWETICRYKGANAAAMIEEILGSIRESEN